MSLFNILQQNNYKVTITDSDWPTEWTTMFQKQVSKVKVSLKQRSVILWVNQKNESPNIMDIVGHLLSNDYEKRMVENINVVPLRSKAFELNFIDGEVVDHEVVFDYMTKGDLIHKITFNFPKVKMINSKGELVSIAE